MKLSESIFDSDPERDAFRALERRWSSDTLRLHGQLPLSKIVVLEPTDQLTDGQLRTFYGTNVDYTFCDQRDRGLFSIEFDGIGGGFDRNGEYQQAHRTSDPHRKLKLDFKLRITRELGYPLVVVSFEELKELDAKESLTILDGIVARFVVRHEEPKLIQQLVEDQAEYLDSLPPWEKHEAIQGLVIDAGLMAGLENDPLERARSEASYEAARYGVNGGYGTRPLHDPPLPEPNDPTWPFGMSPELIRQRIDAFNSAERVGCRATVQTPIGEVVRTIWLRNIGRHVGLMMESVAENAALMLAFRQAAAMMSEHVDPRQP